MADTARKPWYRPRNIALGVLAIFLIVICWAGSWVYWSLTAEPKPSINFSEQLEQVARRAQPPGDNGWPDVQLALDLLDELESAFPRESRTTVHASGFKFDCIYSSDVDLINTHFIHDPSTLIPAREEARKAIEWLGDHGAWTALAAAASKPNIVAPIDSRGAMLAEYAISGISSLRQLARARLATLHLAIEADDAVGIAESLRDLFTLSRAAFMQPWTIGSLVGQSIVMLPESVIREGVRSGRLSEASLRAMLDAYLQNPPPPDLSRAIDGEFVVFQDTVQWVYSDDGHGDGYLVVTAADPVLAMGGAASLSGPSFVDKMRNLEAIFLPTRREAIAQAGSFFERLKTAAALPGPERTLALDAMAADAEHSREILLKMIAPAMARTVENYSVAMMKRNAIVVMLAIECYRAAHGELPPTLTALVPAFLPELPVDCLCDEPFRYRPEQNQELDVPYVLYALGRDCIDDGGRASMHAPDSSLGPHAAPGYDYVVNVPPLTDESQLTPPAE